MSFPRTIGDICANSNHAQMDFLAFQLSHHSDGIECRAAKERFISVIGLPNCRSDLPNGRCVLGAFHVILNPFRTVDLDEVDIQSA